QGRNGCRHDYALRKVFLATNGSPKMKKRRCLVCGLLVGITILHFTAFAEIAKPNSTTAPTASSAPHKTNGQSPRNIEEECEAEWRKEGMMKRGLTEDRYVEQCSLKD